MYGANHTISQILKLLSGDDKRLIKHLVTAPRNKTIFGENLEWIKDYRDFGVLLDKNQLYTLQRRDQNIGRKTYHVIKESPLPLTTAYCMRTNKVYYE